MIYSVQYIFICIALEDKGFFELRPIQSTQVDEQSRDLVKPGARHNSFVACYDKGAHPSINNGDTAQKHC